jgi:molybdopterin molybdotransferase
VISEFEARAKILNSIRPLPPRKMSILDALDCFAAEDAVARLPLPMFDNSAMDGYAVAAGDCNKGARLQVVGEQPAGIDRKLCISKGEAIRIFTGAPIPKGADAVVMQEDVSREGEEIVINADAEPGEFIRQRGCDLAEGQKILETGEQITAPKLALLASQGLEKISIGGEVRVSIVSTGDELASPGEKLEPGQIYDSNSVLLRGLVNRCGATVASLEHCADNSQALRTAFRAAAKSDVVIVTGGVSVGEHDLVRQTLRHLGAEIGLWRVAIKPGKPFMFGHLERVCFFGLPGNPVSAFVTFLQFVRPAILKMMGAADLELPRVSARLAADIGNESDRAHYLRGKLENEMFAPIGRQESHALFGLSQSNALVRLEAGESLKAGDKVEAQIF